MRIGLAVILALGLASCGVGKRASMSMPDCSRERCSGALPPDAVLPPAIVPPPAAMPGGEVVEPIMTGGGAAPPRVPPVGDGYGQGIGYASAGAIRPAVPVFCDVTGDDQTPRDCAAYARARRALADGVAEFKVPESMRVGAPASTVRLAVAFDMASGFPAREVAGLPGRSQRLTLKVSRFMVAELKGANFEVAPAGPVRKDLIAADNAVWSWQVKALAPAGKRKLTLTTWVEVAVPGGTTAPRDVVNTDHDVVVDVTGAARFQAIVEPIKTGGNTIVDLLKIAAAILLALAALFAAYRKLRGGAQTKPPPA